MTRNLMFLGVGLCAVALSGCPSTPSGLMPCDNDSMCPAGMSCQPGGCMPVADGGADDSGHRDGGCSSDATCDDHLYCNGVETCVGGSCHSGTPPCDARSCDESLRRCPIVDHDGDGDPSTTDCDDLDPTRYHGNMAEQTRCDNIDNDCDPSTLGPDADGDGESEVGCCNPQPDGSTLCGTDCDDMRATVNTHALESCNGADDDCDGMIDEGVKVMLWRDNDGDLFGDAMDTPVTGCPDSVPGRVSNGTDCSDHDMSIHPGATEVCNGVDDDCDGNVDNPSAATSLCTVAGQTCVSGSCSCPAGQGVCGASCQPLGGSCSVGVGHCENTGAYVCSHDGTPVCSVGPGSPVAESCNGLDDDCDGIVDNGTRHFHRIQSLAACQSPNDPFGESCFTAVSNACVSTPRTTAECAAQAGFFEDYDAGGGSRFGCVSTTGQPAALYMRHVDLEARWGMRCRNADLSLNWYGCEQDAHLECVAEGYASGLLLGEWYSGNGLIIQCLDARAARVITSGDCFPGDGFSPLVGTWVCIQADW